MPSKRHDVSRVPATPLDAIRSIREQMDDFMSTALRGGPGRSPIGWEPAVDITEQEDRLLLRAELPGLSREDVEVEVSDNILILRGEKKEEHEEKEEGRYLYERQYGRFSRSFPLPRTVDPDRIDARFERGVLTVEMPKSEEKKGRRVEVREGRQ